MEGGESGKLGTVARLHAEMGYMCEIDTVILQYLLMVEITVQLMVLVTLSQRTALIKRALVSRKKEFKLPFGLNS